MKKEVYEIEDRQGVFTIGVTDQYEAYEMMLDWYYEEHRTKEGRFVFDEYLGPDRARGNKGV